jgi:hypothetical protein
VPLLLLLLSAHFLELLVLVWASHQIKTAQTLLSVRHGYSVEANLAKRLPIHKLLRVIPVSPTIGKNQGVFSPTFKQFTCFSAAQRATLALISLLFQEISVC